MRSTRASIIAEVTPLAELTPLPEATLLAEVAPLPETAPLPEVDLAPVEASLLGGVRFPARVAGVPAGAVL